MANGSRGQILTYRAVEIAGALRHWPKLPVVDRLIYSFMIACSGTCTDAYESMDRLDGLRFDRDVREARLGFVYHCQRQT